MRKIKSKLKIRNDIHLNNNAAAVFQKFHSQFLSQLVVYIKVKATQKKVHGEINARLFF